VKSFKAMQVQVSSVCAMLLALFAPVSYGALDASIATGFTTLTADVATIAGLATVVAVGVALFVVGIKLAKKFIPKAV
jgi:hypothetical protein